MRLWSFHPRHLDPKGLGGVWNEGLNQLLPKLQDKDKRPHSGLHRWLKVEDPELYAMIYLYEIQLEASQRGYNYNLFLLDKTGRLDECLDAVIQDIASSDFDESNYVIYNMPLAQGQLDYEWRFYLSKLEQRNREWYERLKDITAPDPHPIFYVIPGPIEPWERVKDDEILRLAGYDPDEIGRRMKQAAEAALAKAKAKHC